MKPSIKEQIAAASQKALLGKKGATLASALHILVRDEQKALTLLSELKNGADFGKLARAHSICPSGKKGGDLGEFRRGAMVPAFDKAVFSGAGTDIQGPIKTKFGYHLIKVLYRR